MALIDLKKLHEAAHQDLLDGKLDDCYPKIIYLLDVNPDHYFYLYLLGAYYSKKENIGASILAYEKAILIAPEFSEAINNVGGCYRKLGWQDKAVETFKKACEIGKTEKFKKDTGKKSASLLADYTSNLGSAYVGMNESKTAIKYLDEAVNIHPKCINAKWNRALAYLELGDYKRGFVDYDFGDRMDKKKGRNYTVHIDKDKETPFWNGEKGKTVVVYGEQGIGDELMFATILPDMAKDCKKVIYDAHPRLYRMFRRSLKKDNIDCYGTRKDHVLAWIGNYDIDCKVPIGSIAKYYRKSTKDFPRKSYLIPDENEIKQIRHRLDALPKKKLNIGLSWKGGTKASSKSVRILPMELYNHLFEELDANFISLQYDDNARYEVDKYNEQTNNTIHHWQKEIDDYDLTCAFVSQLDLIISVPQSVVHLAGAMGVRTYQLNPYRYIWQMGVYGEDMPWYNSVTNIWQREHADWEWVIKEAVKAAKKEFQV